MYGGASISGAHGQRTRRWCQQATELHTPRRWRGGSKFGPFTVILIQFPGTLQDLLVGLWVGQSIHVLEHIQVVWTGACIDSIVTDLWIPSGNVAHASLTSLEVALTTPRPLP